MEQIPSPASAMFSGLTAVVGSALCNDDLALLTPVDNPVRVVDSAAPPSASILPQRLRFTNALKWRTQNILNQEIDPFQCFRS